MPAANRVQAHAIQPLGDILDGGRNAADIVNSKMTVALYGRNGVGKTTLACQGKGPICLISIDPAPTGGARSVANRQDITVYQVASRALAGPDGRLESVRGSEKVVAIIRAIQNRALAAGKCPFRKVVLDGVTSWNEVILGELLGLDYENMPAILGLGKVSADQYIERGERMVRFLKPFFDLPCEELWVLAQERDHNPPKDKNITKSGKEFTRPSQTPLMREAHPMAQEGSFFSLGVSDSQALYIQNACDFIIQLYEDAELREERDPDVVFNGETIPGVARLVATGRRVKRVRCVYHPNYAARFRAPDYTAVPEYIEAPTPEERYQAILEVAAGRRTRWGKYEGTP